MANVAVVGAQWGDEGKGKITDLLAERADVVVRYGGGNNAGHTVIHGDRTLKLHLVPSGILYPTTRCFIGNGTVVDPGALLKELHDLAAQGLSLANLFLSELAHVIMPYHKVLDTAEENRRRHKIGTTGRGIGPAYGDKYLRHGFRLLDLKHPADFRDRLTDAVERVNEQLTKIYGLEPVDPRALGDELLAQYEQLKPYLTDTSLLLHEAVKRGDRILFEGAQGALLDIDMGTYPFVTSSYPVAGGAAVGSGVGPRAIDRVLGIAKAYTTRVGGGPFPSELLDETGDRLRNIGQEFGTTTGRPRRCGWFDAVAARLAARINGLDALAITKLDVLDSFAEIPIVTAYRVGDRLISEFPHDLKTLEAAEPVYETLRGWQTPTTGARTWNDLPAAAHAYLTRLSELVGVRISLVSIGSDRNATIQLEDLLAAAR
jgi:adenylosuccinate synthase